MTLKPESKAFKAFRSVLVVTNVEVHARRDVESIKQFSPKNVKVFTSGTAAVDYISDNDVELILCDTTLSDMSGVKFLQIMRKNVPGRPIPVIMVTLENRKDQVLDAISAGCTGYVLRPYSLDTFEKYLVLAKNLDNYPEIEELELQEAKDMVERGDFDDAIEAFEELISYQDEAQRYYDMGCKYLLQQKYGKAIVSFKRAVKINDLYAEAYKGLAEAYKGKGDEDAYKQYLKKAADLYAQFDRLEEAKQTFIEILKYESDMPNPYNTLGVKLRKQGDYPGALHAYQQAIELTPNDENIYYNMAKALYFMGEKQKAADSITSCLKMNPDFTEASQLYQRIHGKPWTPVVGKVVAPHKTLAQGAVESAKDV